MIEISKGIDEYGDTVYKFDRIDEDGEHWSLGGATIRKQDEGTEDEMVWWSGYFDTDPISFDGDDELVGIIRKRKPADKDDIRFA